MFAELCSNAYVDGDYGHVSVASRAKHEAMKEFIEKTTTTGIRAVTSENNYDLILMTQKMNSLLLSMVNRNMYAESEAKMARERLQSLEYNVDTAKATFESVNKIAESIAEGRQKPPGFPGTQNQ